MVSGLCTPRVRVRSGVVQKPASIETSSKGGRDANDVTPDDVAAIFDRIPSEWISPAQRQFATALLTRTRSILIDKNS